MQQETRRRETTEEDSLGIIACLRSLPDQERVKAAIREFLQSPVNPHPKLDSGRRQRRLTKTEEKCGT